MTRPLMLLPAALWLGMSQGCIVNTDKAFDVKVIDIREWMRYGPGSGGRRRNWATSSRFSILPTF